MKIDWKQVAQSPGYKSLKAAYIHSVQEAARTIQKGRKPMRDKQEFLQKFNWIIGRAEHYAHHRNTTIDVILNEWEKKRDYGWLNYYQEYNQPKLYIRKQNFLGLRRLRKDWKRWHGPVKSKQLVCIWIKQRQADASQKSPKRWTKEQKSWRDRRLKRSL